MILEVAVKKAQGFHSADVPFTLWNFTFPLISIDSKASNSSKT